MDEPAAALSAPETEQLHAIVRSLAAGGKTILDLWVPAEELDEFNAHIVGEIQVVHEFR